MSKDGAPGEPVSVVGTGAQAFAWAPDGVHSVLIDAEGTLHVLPQDRGFPGLIRGIAFSPDGTRVAVCSGRTWPPRITLLALDAVDGQSGPNFEGCEPHWSADSVYLAYRLPSVPAPYGAYDDSGFGVLNTRLMTRFSVPGSWPVAWAPAPDRTLVPLADVSPDGHSVEIMDPRGGQRRVLLSTATIRAIVGGVPVGAIDMMAWSEDGSRLALGFAWGGHVRLGGVAIVDPATREGIFVADRLAPTSLSWSSRGALLIGFVDHVHVVRAGGGQGISISVRDASWSPDGRWILGRSDAAWLIEPLDRLDAAWSLPGSGSWSLARWCCPIEPRVDVGGTGL